MSGQTTLHPNTFDGELIRLGRSDWSSGKKWETSVGKTRSLHIKTNAVMPGSTDFLFAK